MNLGKILTSITYPQEIMFKQLNQGLEGVLRDPGFGRNRARDSGIQKKSSCDS